MSHPNSYIRQIPLIGLSGQKALENATVFIAGAGGLGSPVALYLTSAGIGNLRIADMDTINDSNMNRQILHPPSRIGTPKAASAQKTLALQNPDCHIETFSERIDDSTVETLIGDADLIIDCLDNFETRYTLNRAALRLGKPLLHGAVAGYSGQITLIIPEKTPCLSCIFPHAKTTASPAILGATCGVVGSLQALEAIRVLTGTETLAGKLLIYDGKENTLNTFAVKKSKRCNVCTQNTKKNTEQL